MPETLKEGRYLRLVVDRGWEWCERVNATGIVVIVAVTPPDAEAPAGRLLLVEQHRRPFDARVLELPAGLAGDHGDADEAMAMAAARELEEETGYAAATMEPLFEGPVSAGMTTEYLHWFRGVDLQRVGPGGGDASEDIVVHEVPLEHVEAFLAERREGGALVDPKVYAGLYAARS
jgi:ADP-ribose pyrophosphatase